MSYRGDIMEEMVAHGGIKILKRDFEERDWGG